ncbi:MAG: hypothetical protein ACKO2V_08100 [Snowella sp.]
MSALMLNIRLNREGDRSIDTVISGLVDSLSYGFSKTWVMRSPRIPKL